MLFEEHSNLKQAIYGKLWPAAPLNYGELKKLIYACRDAGVAEVENEFFALLNKETQRVNTVFLKLAESALRDHRRRGVLSSETPSLKDRLVQGLCLITGCFLMDPLTETHPYASASHICNEYARLSAKGMRKILKKYDKCCDSQKGTEHWLSLWRDQTGNVAFLHSPLRIQIDAIESTDALAFPQMPDEMEDGVMTAKCRLRRIDLKCPICLDVLYQPIALSCGHVYCLPCLLAACHLGQSVGTVRALMSNISPDEPCCKCRQEGVYRNAALVPQLEEYIKLQMPGEWNARDREEKRIQAEKRKQLDAARRQRAQGFRGFHPIDLLQ